MNICYHCGGKIKVIKDKPYHYDECGMNVVLYGITQFACIECGETFVSLPKVNELHRAIGRTICQTKKGLLTENEIKFLRKDMHLKAKHFAQALGITASTVSRWENGKNEIGETEDRLLRMFYIMYASEQADHVLCHDVVKMFSELENRRKKATSGKKVKKETEIKLNPLDWMSGAKLDFCTA